MGKHIYLIIVLCIIFSLCFVESAHGDMLKWIKVGKMQDKVIDSGDQGEMAGQGTFGHYYFDAFIGHLYNSRGTQLGVYQWTDENGNTISPKITGAGHANSDEAIETIPLPDAEGITIRRYRRYPSPTIIVDGDRLDEPFPLTTGDEVNPDDILGTADMMVESWIRTSMGIEIHQRVLGWSQSHHDDYLIYDWTLKNTGVIDLAGTEVPQTLDSLYFFRNGRYERHECYKCSWPSAYGEHPEDSLRMIYTYPAWSEGVPYDDFGDADKDRGFIQDPEYLGEAILHVDKSPSDLTDDPSQPQMTCVGDANEGWHRNNPQVSAQEDRELLYQTMAVGIKPYNGTPYMQDPPYNEDVYPGTYHSVRQDEWGYKYVGDLPWLNSEPTPMYSCGPYTMEVGDSLRIVWAAVVGTITPETAWQKGIDWLNENCTWEGSYNKLPPPAQNFPELVPTANDSAKDCWVATGKDSLFKNAWAAQWAVRNDYNVPIPPPAPSIEVTSLPDKIAISWGNESEEASDFAGYRIYRASGAPDYSADGGVVVGKWELIQEFEGSATHSWDDLTAERGVAYFYYVAAFDDGVSNVPGVNDTSEVLESGRYLNMTTKAAHLTRPPKETLSEVRVVPNPFNVGAIELQYPGERDKIMFMNLPPVCTIKIFTESGDLVRTLEHTDNSGDEAWETPTGVQFMTSETGQIVVSGLYIAHIETPDGESTNVKFLIIR